MICLGKSYAHHNTRPYDSDKENIDQNAKGVRIQNKLDKPQKISHLGLIKKVSEQSTKFSEDIQTEDYELTLKRHYSGQIAADYSEQIFNCISSKSLDTDHCLKDHTISPILRARMIDWMIEVLSTYKMTQQSFFKSVSLMDVYLKKESLPQSSKQIHLIGLTCMFIATKYEQIYPLRLMIMTDKVARKKFHPQEIIHKQSRIIEVLNFDLEFPTVYETVKFLKHQITLPKLEKYSLYHEKILIYLTKMCMFDDQLAAVDNSLLGSAIYFIGLKTLEQAQKNLVPEQILPQICRISTLREANILSVSRKVLNLAKNYSRVYPQLTNLKKFNKFTFPNSSE